MAISMLGGVALASYLSSTKPKDVAAPAAPKAPPQPSKAPDAMAVLKAQQGTGQAGGAPGVAHTFLTGAGGIDPALLQLGRTTLLGG